MKKQSTKNQSLREESVFSRFFSPVKIREGHDNFFTPLRLIMAFLVMIGHSYSIALRDIGAEPRVFLHYTFSYLAVNIFFVASGFLVTKSMVYRGDMPNYSSARLLRIYPALIAHVLFLMFIIGPLSTTLPIWEYLTHPDVWKQPFIILSFLDTDAVLPGVFTGNDEAIASGALWTLRYEFLAYVGTALVFSIGLLKRKWMALAQFVLPSILWIIAQHTGFYETLPATFQALLRFGIAYGLGATIYAYRDRISFNVFGIVGFMALALVTGNSPITEVTTMVFLAYSLMYLAYIKLPKLNALQKLSDVSYGVYIYHWCILQLAFQWFPETGPIALLLMAIPATFGLAYGSWFLIEKPMLQSKTRFAEWLRFGHAPKRFDTKKLLLD